MLIPIEWAYLDDVIRGSICSRIFVVVVTYMSPIMSVSNKT